MSTNSQDQEIDLGLVAKGIKNFFQGVINSIFDFIFFLYFSVTPPSVNIRFFYLL